jgi:HD-GYP domain-containing protein (c-di-GMP phosphodiesterase class II)
MKQTSGRDPLEAILALNIGDFLTESFISDELLSRISKRANAEPQQLHAQLEELIQIYSIDKTLSVLELDAQCGFVVYDSIAASLAELFELDACHFFQISKQQNGEQALSLSGTSVTLDANNASERLNIASSTKANNFLTQAYQLDHSQGFPQIDAENNWTPIDRLKQSQTRSIIAAPLKQGARRVGLLLLESYKPIQAFSEESLKLADSTARVLVTSLHLQQLIAETKDSLYVKHSDTSNLLSLRAQITESIADLGIHQQQFIEDLANAVDARHQFTRGYSKRVGQVARRIAEQLRLNEKSIDLIEMAGLLGSVGKVKISSRILGKKEALSPDEWDKLREHPNMGVSLLMKINFIGETTPYVQTQNERWDGSGSPEGLKGRNIPLGSRVLALATAYAAMSQERPYREQALSHTDALSTLEKEVGKNWDPVVFDALKALPADFMR